MNKNVPQIRFQGFHDDWEQRKLGEVGTIVTGNTPSTADEENWASDYTWITPTDIHESFTKNTSRKLSEKGWLKSRNVPANSVLITSIASIGKNTINTVPTAFNQQINAIVPKEHSAIFLLMSMEKNKQKFMSIAGKTATPIINKSTFEKFEIATASILEESQIGGLFKSLDNLITLHQRKLNLLQEQKKSLLQKMFPKKDEKIPEIRFNGFTDDWEQRKLENISNKVTNKNKTSRVTDVFTNSAEYGIIRQRDFFDKDIASSKNLSNYYVVEHNDFIYNPRISNLAPVGPIKRNGLDTGVMSPLYYVFRLHEGQSEFIEQYFKSHYWHRFMKLHGDSGARADRFNIQDAVFKTMPVPFPKIDEQTKISSLLKSVDNLITLHQRKLDALQEQKKGLLQKMFV